MMPSTASKNEATRDPNQASEDVIRQTHGREAGGIWIDGRHFTAENGDQTARVTVGPGVEGHSAFATAGVHLVEGHVQVWLRRLREVVVLAVPDHPYDVPTSPSPHLPKVRGL